ncbi:MAG: hybrid sensor histidine kinase/response regulator [Pseudomonadota bacterium]
MALDIRRFIQRFTEEAADHIPRLREGLQALAQGQTGADQANELFRAAHTVKGSSRMLKLTPITTLAHSMEELLSALRDGQQTATPDNLALLHQAVDKLADQVSQLAESGDPKALSEADPALCGALESAARGRQEAPTSDDTSPLSASPPAAAAPQNAPDELSLRLNDTVRVRLDRLDDVIRLMGEVLSGHHHLHTLVGQIRSLTAALPSEYQAPFHAFHRDFKDSVLGHDALMSDVHDRALQMRMLPLSVVFDPLARMARELAHALSKQVDCRVHGGDIELDRQMIDRLSDPLIHLLRNALDHGIEPPESRQAAGKPPRGQLVLEARQEGGWVTIELHDDGLGIDLEAVRNKALAKQLVDEEQLSTLSDTAVQALIFAPGFSTKAMITDFSGRGVGMDVVKHTVEDDLSGDLRLSSQPGHGTRFTLRLPLSLAMLRILTVNVAGVRVGITAPYVATIIERSSDTLIDTAGHSAVILHNEFVPVTSLAGLLGLEEPSPLAHRETLLLVVVHQQQQKLALVIDRLEDERDCVIKPLPEHLRHLPLVSGMFNVGRNALASLLHVPALLEHSRRTSARPPATPVPRARHILVVDDSLNTREIEKDVLEALGYRVTLAENGRDGLNKALSEPFDAVLTDVEMPVMDGFALTARLRENDRYHERPIIIITSREKEADRRRGIEVGADAYIVKGNFDQNNLVETLNALLG